MTAAVVARSPRRAAGNGLVVAGLLAFLLSVASIVAPAVAISTVLVADDPVALSVAVSQAVVADGEGQVLFVASDLAPTGMWGAPAALAGVPGPGALLFTSASSVDRRVSAELARALAPDGVVLAIGLEAAAVEALQALGHTVVPVVAGLPSVMSVAIADQTFGVAVGTTQRTIAIGAIEGAHRLAAAANVHGANLGIPVVALEAGVSLDLAPTVAREVLLVADPAVVGDGAVTTAGSPVRTRIFDADAAVVAGALDGLLQAEPRDGDLAARAGQSIIALEAAEDRPQPAILAAVIAARDSLDGNDARLVFVADAAEAQTMEASGGTTFLALSHGAAPQPAPAPLPATGGGMVLGVAVAGLGLVLRQRRVLR